MSTPLNKTETTILQAAAAHPDGLIVLPDGMKPASRERLLGRFIRDGLARESEDGHHITPAAYTAIGLKLPRQSQPAGTPRTGTKLALINAMLARPDGATLQELIEATGWLPHTTRAALSRIRAVGQTLDKSPRPDGKTAYRVADAPAAPAGRRRRKAEAATVAA